MQEVRLIDANALKQHYNVPDAEGVFSYCDTIMRVIDEQPTIEAKPVRHGRWIDNGEDKFICSACKGYVYRWFGKSDFCPRCSADMREVEKNG